MIVSIGNNSRRPMDCKLVCWLADRLASWVGSPVDDVLAVDVVENVHHLCRQGPRCIIR